MIILMLAAGGCVTIVKWHYGITNPKEETPERLERFLSRHHYPDTCQYLFSDTASFFSTLRNPLFRKGFPGHLLFDATGALIRKDTSKCQWSGYEIIRSLRRDSACTRSEGLHLADITCHIRTFGADSLKRHDTAADYTVVVTWARFLGTYNERLFDLSNAVRENSHARIRLLLLNMDMQENWNLRRGQKLEMK
jgi:hypothetical protein